MHGMSTAYVYFSYKNNCTSCKEKWKGKKSYLEKVDDEFHLVMA